MAVEIVARVLKNAAGAISIWPDTVLDSEALDAIDKGKPVKVKITVPRNPKFHRKMFALISVIFEFMDDETKKLLNVWTAEELRNRIKIDTGRYTLHIVGAGSTLPEGTPIYIPDSMAYEAMDDHEFEVLFDQTIMISIEKYIPAQTYDSVNEAVETVLRFGS